MALNMNKSETGDTSMRKWTILIEAIIQNAPIRGTVTCYTSNERSAKKLACTTFINQLRRAGIWAYKNEVDESYEVEIVSSKNKKSKKTEIKHKKITKYYAPYWNHVQVIDIVKHGAYDFTFPIEELENAAIQINGTPTKRKSTNETILNKRKKKQTLLEKKEVATKKKEKAVVNVQNRNDLFKAVEKCFTEKGAKIIKTAAIDLSQTYQRIRYALFQIAGKGYNGATYKLIQTEIDGNKAFQLVKQ